MERIILHVDMDYFFAQIEERENPQFKGKPLVVGADPKKGKGRGVVATANYEARKFGIKSGMPISKAWKLCQSAIFLPVNIELYQKVSKKIMEIIKKYSPKYEIVSLDEAYLDLTENSHILEKMRKKNILAAFKEAERIAQDLKREILEKEKLTCTIGIGPNKTVAKLATEKAKPNGLKIVLPSNVQKFLDPLDVDDLPGIGPKTAERLRTIGINTIFQLRNLSKSKLKEMFGKVGEKIWERANGIDKEPVKSEKIIKSIGRQITFEKDTRNPKLIFGTFEKIIKEVYQELIENNLSFRTITVICRHFDFETHTKSRTLKNKTQDLKILKSESKKLLLKFLLENKKPIRLVGLRVKICYN